MHVLGCYSFIKNSRDKFVIVIPDWFLKTTPSFTVVFLYVLLIITRENLNKKKANVKSVQKHKPLTAVEVVIWKKFEMLK